MTSRGPECIPTVQPIWAALKQRIIPAIWRRLQGRNILGLNATPTSRPPSGSWTPEAPHQVLDYDAAFAVLREGLQFLRLPRQVFIADQIELVTGTLGPGGAERQLINTARGLRERGAKVSVLIFNCQPPVNDFHKPALDACGIPVAEVAMLTPEFELPLVQALLVRLRLCAPIGFEQIARQVLAFAFHFARKRPSVVHSWMDAANIVVGTAAQIVGVPAVVCGCRSMAPENFALHQPYMRPGYRSMLGASTVLMLNNSQAGANDYGRWLGVSPETFSVIRNGIEGPKSTPSAEHRRELRANLGIPDTAPVLGSIIRFSEEKRPELLVATAIEVIREHPDAHAVFFGDGPLRADAAKRIRRAGLEAQIHLPGYTTDAWASLGAMDIFMLASRLEGLPNVLIEAQAVGVPVLSTAVGGAPETFIEGETGWSVSPATGKAFAEACLRLLQNDDLRRKAGEQAKVLACQRFGCERMINETMKAYDLALGRVPPDATNAILRNAERGTAN